MKDFIAGKSKADGKIVIGESVSVVIQKKRIRSKRTDSGVFTLPIIIGDVKIEHAMCDLGASINVLLFSVYKKLAGIRLVDTKVVIQLADRSYFHVIRMNESEAGESSRVLLGRPFLRTTKTITDISDDTICLDYNGEKFTFNIDETMKKPLDFENLHSLDEQLAAAELSDSIEDEVAEWCETLMTQDLTDEEINDAIMGFCQKPSSTGSSDRSQLSSLEKLPDFGELAAKNMEKNPLPQEAISPKKELKTLPLDLKYAYLGDEEIFPVIINNWLTKNKKRKCWKC
ncbi:uncharacterized protein LOC121766868 [Salvia splendens]|uniref:uncharacterized protein LOC121766868 n=1 Tax=Salvia splendens TaxID=180675 RepID=UPI001C2804CA|nr:uncharacterized protein LOC121766868 [Salvia splendens]